MNDQEDIRRIRERNQIGVSIQESKDPEWKEIRRKMAEGASQENPKPSTEWKSSMDIWAEEYPHMMLLEPREIYDKAIVGMVERINLNVFCYDSVEILLILQNEFWMTAEGAEEHFEYNIRGSYMGENSPVFLNKKVEL